MAKRLMLFGFLASLLQVIVYYFIIFFLWNVGRLFYIPRSTDYIYDFNIIMSITLFCFLIFIQNILIEIVNNKKFAAFILIIITTIVIIGWGEDIYSFPFETIILTVSGIITLIIKFLFDLNYKNLKSSIVNLKS